jgi:hypothetical protein
LEAQSESSFCKKRLWNNEKAVDTDRLLHCKTGYGHLATALRVTEGGHWTKWFYNVRWIYLL